MKNTVAFGLIDAQRGFMPATEGERLGLEGFGELPINDGNRILPAVNRLLGEFTLQQLPIFTTQDWHPADTAHFAQDPNFATTWPVHCVGETPGAEFHPEIKLPEIIRNYKKGFEKLERGEDDTSYSGFNAYNDNRNEQPFDYLKEAGTTVLVLGGLALDYCVKATALDFKQKAGLDVVIAVDATRSVDQETGIKAITELETAGVKFATTDQIIRQLNRI